MEAFQYISCCSLSQRRKLQPPSNGRFNTSHVVVYLLFLQYCCNILSCFNTSHVVVYLKMSPMYGETPFSFNTSHVVVYLAPPLITVLVPLFQYISCCSLSLWCLFNCDYELKFQYISCCSLSNRKI